MTRKSFVLTCLAGLALWALIVAGSHYAKTHSHFWFDVLMSIWCLGVAVLLTSLWKAVAREDDRLEYEAARRREAERYDYDEYEAPQPPRAA
jgi:hypothetical protein